tara:strand:+ start:3724 stop:5058 length:1335 start_codon:yes stop_codon:yes gene_type:complete
VGDADYLIRRYTSIGKIKFLRVITKIGFNLVKEGEYRSWEFSKDVLRLILREWGNSLSNLEFRTVLFIYDRTVGWGKKWERITGKHFCKGVWSDEKCYASPISTNRGYVSGVVANLIERGAILRERTGNSYKYCLNLDWNPKMKIPKRLKQNKTVPKVEQEVVQKWDSESVPIVEQQREINNNRENSPTVAPDGADKIGDALIEMEKAIRLRTKKSAQRLDRLRAKGKYERRANGEKSGFVPSRSSLPEIWRSLFTDNYPKGKLPPVAKASLSILHKYAVEWTKSRDEGEFLDYLRWVFENWKALKELCFYWMSDYPDSPSINIMVNSKIRHKIEDAYNEQEKVKRWRSLDEWERKYERLIERGMDHEKAEGIAKRETGYKDIKDELRRERELLEKLRVKLENEALKAGISVEEFMSRQEEKRNKRAINNEEGSFGEFESGIEI